MASIFGGSFVDNLRRLYTSARTQAPESRTTEVGPENFGKILGDLQRKGNPKESKGLASTLESAPDSRFRLSESLTNFSITEERDTRLRVDTGLKLQSSPELDSVRVPSPVPKQPAPVTPPVPEPRLPEPYAKLGSARPSMAPSGPPHVPQINDAHWERIPFMQGFVPTASTTGDVKAMIERAGGYHGIDPFLSLAVARAESNFEPQAVSRDGHRSKGVFQLLDSTAHDMIKRVGWPNEYDPFEPALNTHLGVGYLRRLHDLFSRETDLGFDMRTVAVSSARDREKLAVAAFNAGEGRVARAQRTAELRGADPTDYNSVSPYLPQSTRTYVDRVLRFREEITTQSDQSEFV